MIIKLWHLLEERTCGSIARIARPDKSDNVGLISSQGLRLEDITEAEMEQLLDEVQKSQGEMKKMMSRVFFPSMLRTNSIHQFLSSVPVYYEELWYSACPGFPRVV